MLDPKGKGSSPVASGLCSLQLTRSSEQFRLDTDSLDQVKSLYSSKFSLDPLGVASFLALFREEFLTIMQEYMGQIATLIADSELRRCKDISLLSTPESLSATEALSDEESHKFCRILFLRIRRQMP